MVQCESKKTRRLQSREQDAFTGFPARNPTKYSQQKSKKDPLKKEEEKGGGGGGG